MTEYIEDCDLYAAASYHVTISSGKRVLKKLPLKARVDVETGEVTLYVDSTQIAVLQR